MPPLPSLHPLPANPTTGQLPLASLGGRAVGGPPPASAAGGGGVSREVLKGLQDVAWSDDEDEPDCLLCAEPLDLSDLSFKPCQCGMQICQFCYNKLLQTDARCPGCRRPYDAKAVVFQPVDVEEVKRAKEKKTRRAKTIKQLTGMGRRHLLGVRVVMKNMVYVVGMKLPAPGDEAIPILRSNDYFGQYGKISKLYLRDRTSVSSTSVPSLSASSSDASATSTGIYIVYVRREDAARAISALDGIPAPQGPPGQILRATYGTTRYCDAFLRGAKCDNQTCPNLHEWGGDSDCFTKEDMETALTRPQEYDARQKQASFQPAPISQKLAWPKPAVEDPIGTALPNSASWAKSIVAGRAAVARPPAAIARPVAKPNTLVPLTAASLTKNPAAFPLPTPSPALPTPVKKERKTGSTSMSRGRSTDSAPSTNAGSKPPSPKKIPVSLPPVTVPPKTTSVTAPVSVPPPPPPGLGLPTDPALSTSRSQPPTAAAPESFEPPDESATSAFSSSEAGPSSSSPAPRTPGRSSLDQSYPPPPPLTSDPIQVHSPYEEPQIYAFPSPADPGFVFELGLDDIDLRDSKAYQPKPFSKMLVGLAEIGVLAPEVNELLPSPSRRDSLGFTGSFQPFDGDLDVSLLSDPIAGPSRAGLDGGDAGRSIGTEEPEEEGPRMTSRFDFARPGSAAARGQSPFSVMTNGRRRSVMTLGPQQEEWLGRPPTAQGYGMDAGPGAGSFSSAENAWPGAGGPDFAGGGGGSPYARTAGVGSYGQSKGRERDDFDGSPNFPFSTPSTHPTFVNAHNRLFSPDVHFGGGDEQVSLLPHHAFQQQHQAFQSGLPLGGGMGAQRGNGQQQQQQAMFGGGGGWGRAGSPSPLAQGFRRF